MLLFILAVISSSEGIICRFKPQSVREEDFVILETAFNVKSHLICSLKADSKHYPIYK